jgi:hypothetical protein
MATEHRHAATGNGERVTVTSTHTDTRPVGYSRRERHDFGDYEVDIPEAYNLRRDRVRMGPIIAGFLTALTTLLLLGLLGLAVGFTTVNAGDAAIRGGVPEETGRNSLIWALISGIAAFFIGGWVAGRTAAVFDRKWGLLNGALVFFLAVPVTLWLASQGLGAVLGGLGGLTDALNPGQVQAATDNARNTANNVQPIDVARTAEGVRNTAWGAFVGSLLALWAAALGGFAGTRRELEIDRRTGDIHE